MCPASWDALSNKKKILICWMNQDRKIWDAKSAIFNHCLVHISLKPADLGLKILSQTLHYSPNISSKFQPIWMFLKQKSQFSIFRRKLTFLRGGGLIIGCSSKNDKNIGFFIRKFYPIGLVLLLISVFEYCFNKVADKQLNCN